MTKRLFFFSTALFWALVAGVTSSALLAAPEPAIAEGNGTTARVISATELARHASTRDCWMAIRGTVYDLTAYLPQHPAKPEVMNVWCGKEATEAYNTKGVGRPHSKYTDQMLERMHKIGELQKKP